MERERIESMMGNLSEESPVLHLSNIKEGKESSNIKMVICQYKDNKS